MAVVKVQFANENVEIVSVRDENDQLWLLANPFARILEYSNAPKAISTYVTEKNQKCLEQMQSAQLGKTILTSSSIQAKSKFINKAGLFELIQASRMPKAQEFRNWVNSDLLVKLCDGGEYSMRTDAPASVAEGMNVLHKATNNGDEAPWMKDMDGILKEIEKRDETINILTRDLRTANQNLMEFAKEIIKGRQDLAVANQSMSNLANRVVDMAQDVAVKPADPNLRHSLAVCAIGNDQYAFLRPQKRSLKRSLDRLSADEQNIVFQSDYVPNAMNVLNKVKEALPKKKYTARHNKITLLEDFSRDELLDVISSTLAPRQVALAANKCANKS
ncbi:BRO-B [Agrotis ipsilon multiple nucleopolyhedrovirus]|uniref:BRO-B n=1 Tax=Agrotis ipsilon multiple nucleopolyhedrovirus TaxID=208013 RepID=B6D5Y2_9ABAC|nr:BRO-B [Agrotis ipsilon multiple nucleopolyhedrovirus]ACI28770.1 BRO-B [Agrotis ipsilon multiple nucleopolyhedrovirus]